MADPQAAVKELCDAIKNLPQGLNSEMAVQALFGGLLDVQEAVIDALIQTVNKLPDVEADGRSAMLYGVYGRSVEQRYTELFLMCGDCQVIVEDCECDGVSDEDTEEETPHECGRDCVTWIDVTAEVRDDDEPQLYYIVKEGRRFYKLAGDIDINWQ